jgi:hypothetical protein
MLATAGFADTLIAPVRTIFAPLCIRLPISRQHRIYT